MENDPALLNAMMEDQQRQKRLYRPGSYWEGYCKRVAGAIGSKGVVDFRSNHAISKGYADSVLLDPSVHWDHENWKLRLLKKIVDNPLVKGKVMEPFYLRAIRTHYDQMRYYRQYYYEKAFGTWLTEMMDRFDLPDTLVGGCKEFVYIKDTPVSVNYITHLMRVYNFAEHLDFTRIGSVFEIGGGFGANAHLLIHMYPNIRKYLYIDIPPMLYVGAQYLKHFFHQQVIDYAATRNMENISFKKDDLKEILAVCPWQMEKTNVDIDLFWNSASFQEMEPEAVRNYSDYVKAFTGNRPQSHICLVIYKGGDPKRTLTAELIVSMFEDRFAVKEIFPSIEMENPPQYFIGERK